MGMEATAKARSRAKKSSTPPVPTTGLEQLLRLHPPSVILKCGKTVTDRPVDWRWALAGFLTVDSCIERWCSEEMDEPVVGAAHTVRELRSSQSLESLKGCPATLEAIGVRISPSPRSRWAIEARILAGQTPAEIAVRCGVTPETVQVYEDWFYDVRDRPPEYADTLLFPLNGPVAEVPIEYVWKLVGHTCGPDLLDDLLRDAGGRIDAENADPGAWLRGDTEERALLRRWIFMRVESHLKKTPKVDGRLTLYRITERSPQVKVSIPAFPIPEIRDLGEVFVVGAPGASEGV